MRLAALCILACLAACATAREQVPPIGTASRSTEFDTYPLRRVGILLPEGEGMDAEFLRGLRDALATEIAATKPYEIVPLDEGDVEAVDRLDTARTGRIRPAPVLALARRSSLDGSAAGGNDSSTVATKSCGSRRSDIDAPCRLRKRTPSRRMR